MSVPRPRSDTPAAAHARDLIEQTVRLRATHRTRDQVGDTRSYANMERTLKREYWGRFLIELLQNARDAWNSNHADATDGVVLVRLTSEPALIIANQGEALRPEVLLDSISKFGESTKEFGAAIGHKGIGFKAVLEISLTPEIYSRAATDGPFDLRARFDPQHARDLIHEMTPDWSALVSELVSAEAGADPDERIPVLRFPAWIEEPGSWLDEAQEWDGHAFNTVIKLPFDHRYVQTLRLDRAAFIERVRMAMGELSDEIVLLLRSFGTIVLEDEIGGDSRVVKREEVTPSREPSTFPTETAERYSTVRITRNGVETSRWLLAEEQLSGAGLDEEVAVGVRLLTSSTLAASVEPAVDSIALPSADPAGPPFHLFFPTRIPSHLPFLLHAYFQVDAGRKGFAEDEAPRNLRLLEALRSLTVRVVRHLAALHDRGEMDVTPLAGLFAATAGDGDERSARDFREALLHDLDEVEFVPSMTHGVLVTPSRVLADPRANLTALLPQAFPPHYLAEQAGLHFASEDVSHPGLNFLAERAAIARGTDLPGLDADTLARLLRPAAGQLWSHDIDAGFVALLQVLETLRVEDPAAAVVVTATVGDETATFLPVSHDEPPYRRLRSPAPTGTGVVMARLRAGEETTLVPPQGLGIDSLGEGALPSGMIAGIANELGIREYTTDAVLDAIAARGDRCDPNELLRFVWRLLLRERRSAFSVPAALDAAQMFQPGSFFWAASGQHGTDPDRARQLRALNAIRLPTRSGAWRPATDLCFGADWGDWLASTLQADVGAASAHRTAAYRDMEAIAPTPDDLLAGPERLSQLLPHIPTDTSWSATEAGPTLPEDSISRQALLLHVFLLRLGVWEVPPVQAVIDYVDRSAERRDPWSTRPGRTAHLGQVREAGGQFAAYGHANAHVAEDAALTWPLQTSAAYVRSLGRGSELYESFRRIGLYCPGCKTHTTRYRNLDAADQPSYLLHQLSSAAWVPVELSGRAAMPVHPRDAWLEADRPEASRIAQSPLRFLPLASPDLDERLAHLVGIKRLEGAGAGRLTGLLRELRRDFRDLVPEGDERAGSVTATAFAGLHRQVYERVARLDAEAATAIAEELGVLAVRGRRLEYVPPPEARHDDGRWATYKRHFLGRIPFSVLAREQGTTAAALGISRFELSITRIDAGTETNVTEQVRPLVRERAPELLALQVFHPLGGPAVDLSGRTFTERAARLEGLAIIQVDNLVVELQVVDSEERERIGTERDRDVMVENPTTSHPVLYHDLSGSDWVDRLRDVLGHHLAVIMENPSYGPLFQLLLQQDDEAQHESFLLEHGVSDDELAQVRAHMGGRDDLEVQRRWWRAVLPLVGAPGFADGDDPSAAAELALADAGLLADNGSIGVALRAAGGDSDIRTDDDPSGILARLEREGIDLRALDATLRAAGDHGLRIDAAARRLGEWRRSYGREVAALLAARGKPLTSAREAPGAWQIVESARYTIAVQPADYLRDVLLELRSVGLEPDAEALAGPDARAHLHALHGDAGEPLDALWERLFGEVDAERLERERANAWRRAVRVLLTAALTRPEEPSYRIRTEAEFVDRALPQSPSRPEDLLGAVASLLVEGPWLTEAIRRLMEEDERLAVPAVGALTDRLRDLLRNPAHLDRVSALLAGGARGSVDQVRRQVAKVQELGLRPVVAVTSAAGPRTPPQPRPPSAQRPISGPPRRHDQRQLDRLGADGEQWALAAVVEGLLALPPADYHHAVAALRDKLASAFSGPIVDGLLRHADEAVAQDADDDDRVEALVAFLHVAKKSDEFGFDMLGWLPAVPDEPPRPLLLEVKNSRDRRLNVSANEWRTAERERGDFAFLIVVRGTDRPVGMELLPDPVGLLREGRLSRSEDGWVVGYALDE